MLAGKNIWILIFIYTTTTKYLEWGRYWFFSDIFCVSDAKTTEKRREKNYDYLRIEKKIYVSTVKFSKKEHDRAKKNWNKIKIYERKFFFIRFIISRWCCCFFIFLAVKIVYLTMDDEIFQHNRSLFRSWIIKYRVFSSFFCHESNFLG